MEHFLTLLHIDTTNEWLLGFLKALVIVIFYLVFIFLHRSLVTKLLEKILSRTQVPAKDSLIVPIDRLVRRLVLFFALSEIADGFPLGAKFESSIQNFLFVIAAYVVLTVAYEIFDLSSGQISRMGATEFLPLLSKLFKTLSALVAIMVVMRHFNYDIWHIMTALGIGSLAIGLAAQPTLSNMIAGFTILLDRPFRPADHIVLGGGGEGDVLTIGMRSTRIKTPEGNILVVPNSELVNSRVVNYNDSNTRILQKVKFQFAYESDFKLIKQLLAENARRIPEIEPDTVNIYLTNVLDSRIEVTIQYYVKNFTNTTLSTDKIIDSSIVALRQKEIQLAAFPFYSH